MKEKRRGRCMSYLASNLRSNDRNAIYEMYDENFDPISPL